MKRFKVIGKYHATKEIGVYEAEDEADAIKMAEADDESGSYVMLCHSCDDEIDLNQEPYDFFAEETDEPVTIRETGDDEN